MRVLSKPWQRPRKREGGVVGRAGHIFTHWLPSVPRARVCFCFPQPRAPWCHKSPPQTEYLICLTSRGKLFAVELLWIFLFSLLPLLFLLKCAATSLFPFPRRRVHLLSVWRSFVTTSKHAGTEYTDRCWRWNIYPVNCNLDSSLASWARVYY